MKKLLAILLSAICAFSLASCALAEDSEAAGKGNSGTANSTPENSTGPGNLPMPGLIVSLGEAIIQASPGSCHWTCDNEYGTGKVINADSVPALEVKEHLPSLTLNPGGTTIAKLEFSSAPDTVRVNCWSYEEERLFDNAFVEIEGEQNDRVLYLDLARDVVVEVYAEWRNSEEGSGSVYYGFCVRTAQAPTLLKDGNVTEVTVSSLPNGYNYAFSGESAGEVADYLRCLHLIADFPENPDEYVGMTWVVELEYEDGSELTVYHFGNMFVRNEDGPWYRLEYDEASYFSTLLNELDK